MAIIVLSIYKTCNKYYETRRRSYMPIQRGDLNDFSNSYDYTNYPAPPPPYISDSENMPNSEEANALSSVPSNITVNNSNNRNNATDVNITAPVPVMTRSGYQTPPPEYEEDIKTQK